MSLCLDQYTPQINLLKINKYTRAIDTSRTQMKYSKDYIGHLIKDLNKIDIYKKNELKFQNTLLFKREQSKIIDFDFVKKDNNVVVVSQQAVYQQNLDKLKNQNQNKTVILSYISDFHLISTYQNQKFKKVLANQNSIVILCQNDQILRIQRDITISFNYKKKHSFKINGLRSGNFQTFAYLSSQTVPTQQQQKYVKQKFWLNQKSDYEYIIIKKRSQTFVYWCSIIEYEAQSCKLFGDYSRYSLTHIAINYNGNTWMGYIQQGFDLSVYQFSFNGRSPNTNLAKFQNVYIKKLWMMDYQNSRFLILLDGGSLKLYSKDKGSQQTQILLQDYKIINGSQVTEQNVFYDIKNEKVFYSTTKSILAYNFICKKQSQYQPVASCFIQQVKDCINFNKFTNKCQDDALISVVNITQKNNTTQQPVQPAQPSQPVQPETLDEEDIYLSEKEIQALNMMSEKIKQANQGAKYAIWTFSAIPLSAFFMGFINFWRICSFYAFLEIDMPIFLRKILIHIFTMLNSSLLEFIGLQNNLSLSIKGQTIKQRLQENIVKDFELSSDFYLMNGQNFIVYLCGIVLTIFIHLGYKVWTKIFKEKKEKQSFYSFFLIYFGQTVSLFPCVMIGFWMLKDSSAFSNGSEKLNAFLYHFSICIIFLVPFLLLSYIEVKHCQEYKKAKRRQTHRAFQANEQVLETPKPKIRASRLHKKLEWFYLTQCNVLIPMAALISYPILSLTICFGLFGLSLYLCVKNKESGILRKINQVVLALQLMMLNCLFLGIMIAGDNGMHSLKLRFAFGCIILIAIGTIHQVLTLIIVDIIIDKVFYLFQKIRKICSQSEKTNIVNSNSKFGKTFIEKKQIANPNKPKNINPNDRQKLNKSFKNKQITTFINDSQKNQVTFQISPDSLTYTTFQQQATINNNKPNFRPTKCNQKKFIKVVNFVSQGQKINYQNTNSIFNNRIEPLNSKKTPRTLKSMKQNFKRMKVADLSLKRGYLQNKDTNTSYVFKKCFQKKLQTGFQEV